MNVKRLLEKFAGNTSLHGVPKVIRSKSTPRRIFWSTICISALIMFCFQTAELLTRFFSYPKKVIIEVVTEPVQFPAISLCNMRPLDFHVLNKLFQMFQESLVLLNHIDSPDPFVREYMRLVAKYAPSFDTYQDDEIYGPQLQEAFSRITLSSNIPQDIIEPAAIQTEEFVVKCQFGGVQCNRSESFTTFFDPYYFNCFTYTAPGSLFQNTTPNLIKGIENGWSSVVFSGSGSLDRNQTLYVIPGLHESRSPVAASEGVRVVIHPPGVRPFPFTEGYDVPPGFSASFALRPREIVRLGAPYGNCTNVNPFDESDGRYREVQCEMACIQERVVRECHCKDNSLPDLPDQEAVKSCRTNDEMPDVCMHEASQRCLDSLSRFYQRIQCMRQTRDFLTKSSQLMQACRCNPPCAEVYYDVSYSLSKWPASGFEGDNAYYEVMYTEQFIQRFEGDESKKEFVRKYFNESNRENSMLDFARINVYVAESNVVKTIESPDYTSNQLVSDIGGQLGFWIGISVITLTEVLELLSQILLYLLSSTLSTELKLPPKDGRVQRDSSMKSRRRRFGEAIRRHSHQGSNDICGNWGQGYRAPNHQSCSCSTCNCETDVAKCDRFDDTSYRPRVDHFTFSSNNV